MAKTPRWTRDSALAYLTSNPNFTFAKPRSDYSTPYLKRTASSLQDAEQAGRAAPTTAQRRGHARAPVTHLDSSGHRLNQWSINAPLDRDIDQADLKNLYKYAKKGKVGHDEVLVIITGVVDYIPVKGSIPDNKIQTLSFWSDMESLKEFIDTMSDIYEFAETISGLKWEEVLAVAFAFPNEVSK